MPEKHELPPDRWLRCPRYGQRLECFLPFKTPLDFRYDPHISEEYRFTPEMFVQKWRGNKVKLGLVIDLTNTERFYDKSFFEENDVKYIKHRLRGHNQAPTKEQTSLFVELCHQFISHHPLHFIGVHCTHGFNRTGFLICAYLYEKLDWDIDAAVHAYANIRPPGIYKQDYREIFLK